MRAIPTRAISLTAATLAAAVFLASCGSQNPAVVTVVVTPGQSSTPVTVSAAPINTEQSAPAAASSTPAASSASGAPRVVASPAFGSTTVSPTEAVKVNVLGGTIKDLVVTADDGAAIAGELASDKRTFTVTDRLRYGTTYTFKGKAVGSDGKDYPLDGTLTTVKPTQFVSVTTSIRNNEKYGVGQPVIIYFKPAITDKAAAERALKVTTDKGVIEGSWGWLQDEAIDKGDPTLKSQVQFRPKELWPAHTKVTVQANFYGVNMGGDWWGSEDKTIQLNVDRKLVVQADVPSHHMVVMIDDKVWKKYPVSYGAPRDGRDTTSGRHLVQEKHANYSMSSPRYGYYNFKTKWAVRINNNGEFVHENQAVADSGHLGKRNVSHGCVNMSEVDAHDFYNAVLIGDVVDISGTNTPLSERDWNYVWKYTWEQWKALSKIR